VSIYQYMKKSPVIGYDPVRPTTNLHATVHRMQRLSLVLPPGHECYDMCVELYCPRPSRCPLLALEPLSCTH
jgi:hypothetical protein